jgi:hypothetical protein
MRFAHHLQVFWFTSYGKDGQKRSFPHGHFGVAKPDSSDLHDLWRGAVEHATEHGYEVCAGCCDGAPENEKFVKAICTHSSNGAGFRDHYIDADTGEPVFFLTCQTHLLKKLRNNMYRSGRATKDHTRLLNHFDRSVGKWQYIEWQTLQNLYKEDRKRFPILTRLTKDHLVCAGQRDLKGK